MIAALLSLACVAPAPVPDVKVDETTRKAIGRALDWLAQRQNPDGSWGEGKYPHNTAVTSFALLAFLADGHLPGQGKYGPEVARGARFLVASSRPQDGYLVGARGGNMYCHGMATLTLAQLWGQTGDEEMKPVLKRAVELIVRCQSGEGGWRYDPRPSGADISVTIMQVMALRAAKNSGLHVPERTLHRAIAYINRCHEPRSGGFNYQPGRRDPGFARTAAGVCVLQLTGNYQADEVDRGVDFLLTRRDEKKHFWYGQYYAAHALHQVGGERWEQWYAKMRDLLLSNQAADGSWARGLGSDDGVGPSYTTAIAVIILAAPADYLPIFRA